MNDEQRLEEEARPQQMAEHNVLAAFVDMDAARKAIDALEGAGIESGKISLLGRAAEEAAGETDTTDRDIEGTAFVGKRAAVGGAVGSATGGLAGFLAGAAAFGIPGVGPVIGAGIWASTIAGAIAGGAVGGVVGGISSIDVTPAWELTLESVKAGRAVVGVHSDAEDDVRRGEEALRSSDPVTIDRFDSRGRRLGA